MKNENLLKTSSFLEKQKFDFKVKDNTLKVLVDNHKRQEVFNQLKAHLKCNGFSHDPYLGGSLGRLYLKDKNGNVYILVKPNSSVGNAANIGKEYEEELCRNIKEKFPDLHIKTAGFDHGSDLEISNGENRLSIEVKTSCSADFGQFKLAYDLDSVSWQLYKTKNVLKNFFLFNKLFELNLKTKLSCFDFSGVKLDNLNIKSNKIIGIKPGPESYKTKTFLQEKWFKGNDLKIKVDFQDISSYYKEKGDDLIQIRNKGLYSFGDEHFSFLKNGTDSHLRFRIKPHMSKNGPYSFTNSIKVGLRPSQKNLDNPEDMGIIQELLYRRGD